MAHEQHQLETTLRASIASVITLTGEQYKDLASVAKLAPELVSRRQRGLISWKISDIGRLADHWGIPSSALFAGPTEALSALTPDRVAELRRAKDLPVAATAA